MSCIKSAKFFIFQKQYYTFIKSYWFDNHTFKKSTKFLFPSGSILASTNEEVKIGPENG